MFLAAVPAFVSFRCWLRFRPTSETPIWPGSRVGEFVYVLHQSTGLQEALVVDGKNETIVMVGESMALDAFRALDGEVLQDNASHQRRIHVVGELSPETKWTPKAPNLPGPDAYREFRLFRWWIETPVQVSKWDMVQGLLTIVGWDTRPTLTRHDFSHWGCWSLCPSHFVGDSRH